MQWHQATRKPWHKANRALRCIGCICAVLLSMSSVSAQTESEVSDMVRQIDQLQDAGKFQEAVPIAEKVLKYCEKNDGPDHPETAGSLNDLASLYSGMGNYSKAIPLYERALKIREKALGKGPPVYGDRPQQPC